jgi:hypothetical protein
VIEPFKDIEDARALAQAIVDTVREPLLVLDGDLRVLAVSRSYYLTVRTSWAGRSMRSATVSGRYQLFAWHCHTEQVEAVFDRGEARLRHWNRLAGHSPGRQ